MKILDKNSNRIAIKKYYKNKKSLKQLYLWEYKKPMPKKKKRRIQYYLAIIDSI